MTTAVAGRPRPPTQCPQPAEILRAADVPRATVTPTRWRRLTASLRVLPDYLVLGAQRSGTTSLHHDLEAHPAVAPVATKEVHFFDLDWRLGEAHYRSHFPTRRRMERLQARHGTASTGEASPYYLLHPHAPGRAAGLLPDARLIVILREPVERAHSQYRHERSLGTEDCPRFEQALAREDERLAGELERMAADPLHDSFALQHHAYFARGLYAGQLRAWWRHFPRERTLVLTTDEWQAEPGATYDRVLSFLGLPAWRPPSFAHLNATRRSQIDPALRRRLAEAYAPHVRELEELLGRKLPWTG